MADRYVLLDEVQRCIWNSPSEVSEIAISIAYAIDDYATGMEAIAAAEKLVIAMGGSTTYADVRPIEECAICGADFDTTRLHHTITVSHEEGPTDSPTILAVSYVARICARCSDPNGQVLTEGGI
jgi:hypothetical protein